MGHFYSVFARTKDVQWVQNFYYFEFKYDDLIKCKTLQDYTEMAAVAIIQAEIAGGGP